MSEAESRAPNTQAQNLAAQGGVWWAPPEVDSLMAPLPVLQVVEPGAWELVVSWGPELLSWSGGRVLPWQW